MRARAAAAFVGALALAGCASTNSADLAIGDMDEDGCVVTSRVSRPQQRRLPQPLGETSAEWRYSQARLGSPFVSPRVEENQKLVTQDLYYEIRTCPKITIPEKSKD